MNRPRDFRKLPIWFYSTVLSRTLKWFFSSSSNQIEHFPSIVHEIIKRTQAGDGNSFEMPNECSIDLQSNRILWPITADWLLSIEFDGNFIISLTLHYYHSWICCTKARFILTGNSRFISFDSDEKPFQSHYSHTHLLHIRVVNTVYKIYVYICSTAF